jgi:Ca2+-binding EF-hand superfamily protein
MQESSLTDSELIRKRCDPLLRKVRELALRRGDGALRDLARHFGVRGGRAASKRSGVVKINPDEFRNKMSQFGISLDAQECNILLSAFRDAVGYLLVSEFIEELQRTLNDVRLAVVRRAFRKLDAKGKGSASSDDIKRSIDFSSLPEVQAGNLSEEAAARRFLDVFDDKSAPDGVITEDEFVSYYAAVSLNIASDGEFVKLVEGAWKMKPAPDDADAAAGGEVEGGSESASLVSPRRRHVLIDGPLPRDVGESTRCICGFAGHVPFAQERYGETFQKTVLAAPRIGKRVFTVEYSDTAASVSYPAQTGNKANTHNFRFS